MGSYESTDTHKVVATVEFDFQGRHYAPSVELDVGELMERHGRLPDIYSLLANTNGIDDYSYEIDIMVMEPIRYSVATGLIADYIEDGNLNEEGFNQAWNQQRLDRLLNDIADRFRHESKNGNDDALARALESAYKLGIDVAQRRRRQENAG